MSLASLSVQNVRCLVAVELVELGPGQNLVWGANGSGKTTLLESIFLLGRGRSFRTRNTERLIRRGENHLLVVGRTRAPEQTIGVQVERHAPTVAKVGGAFVSSLGALSQAFPVQAIDPSVHKLVEEGGTARRRWMDWAVFHVEQGFLDNWARYSKALKQRNAALRSEPAQAAAWEPELLRLGAQLAESRRRIIDRLQPYWREVVQRLTGLDVDLTYSQGWPRELTFAEAMAASRPRDSARGLTHVGPHRGDVQIRLGTAAARDVLSRGQQKLVAVAMILAQLRMLRELFDTTPTLLLDDPAAELDQSRTALFIEEVERLRCQLVLTSLAPDRGLFGRPDRTFHVEHGNVRSV
jgi:DNA replication and repair protein RecF